MTSLYQLAAISLALALAACSSTPTKEPASDTQPAEIVYAPSDDLSPREQVTQLLELAETAEIPLKQRYQLKATELLLRELQNALAEELLGKIDTAVLPAELQVHYASLAARTLRNQGLFQNALNVLNEAKLQDMILLAELPRQLQVSQLRASLHALEGMHLAAAQERIYIDPLLSPEQQRINREGVWHSLSYVPTRELIESHRNASNRDFLGWLELASIAKANQGDIDTQVRQLDAWNLRWPSHPAAGNLPGGLANIGEMAAEKPQQIALLLPFTGKLAPLGKAIRDGFLATYHQTRASGNPTPNIKTYDSSEGNNVGQLYLQAVLDGAQLVIGPLRKEVVDTLLEQVQDFTVPVLALNRARGDNYPPNVYQFALAPEDEAQQIAEIAANEGFERALVLTPSSEWGRNIADTFNMHWQKLGGKVIAQAGFNSQANDYSKIIKDAMQLDLSEKRAQKLGWLLGDKIEFQPRRRADVDFIFLVARPQEAHAIKPLLAYHYAGNLPVYATSHIYNGIPSPAQDRDIDGVKFVDTPWSLTDQAPEKAAILKEIPQSRNYQRMYALGVDAYRLYPRLQQMALLGNSRVYGETGSLRLNAAGQIERELLLAVFENGRAKNIPLTDTALDKDIHDQQTTVFPSSPTTQSTIYPATGDRR
jgi:outer membrane PBP1 activator LpoA protein